MSGLVPENLSIDGAPVAAVAPIVAPAAAAPLPAAVVSPTQQVVLDANATVFGTDARGRKIGAKRISMSVRRRVMKVLSAEAAGKPQYVGMVMLAASCESIEGEPVGSLDSELKIDALIDRLDDEGYAALSTLQGQFAAKIQADVKN